MLLCGTNGLSTLTTKLEKNKIIILIPSLFRVTQNGGKWRESLNIFFNDIKS